MTVDGELLQNHITKIFLNEIVTQAENAMDAHTRIEEAMAKEGAVKELFRHLESFLNYAAKISLLLWPSSDGNAERGKQLRNLLEIPDENPIKERSARNHLQHFDERLDKWAAATENGNYVDLNTGSSAQYAGFPVLRLFDKKRSIFTFRSEDFDIGSLAEAIRAIAGKANAKLIELDIAQNAEIAKKWGTPTSRPM